MCDTPSGCSVGHETGYEDNTSPVEARCLPFSIDVALVYGLGHDTCRQERVIENGLSALAGQDGSGNMKNGVHLLSSLAACTARRMKMTNESGVDNGG